MLQQRSGRVVYIVDLVDYHGVESGVGGEGVGGMASGAVTA